MIKQTIRIATVLVVLVLILWGASHFMKNNPKDLAIDPCALDLTALNVNDPEGKLKTDEEIVRAMFDHYFSAYLNNPGCPATSLEASRLVSIDKTDRDKPDHMLAEITFDLKSTSIAETGWATPETSTTSDGWIKNKKGTLSIGTASSTYFLII